MASSFIRPAYYYQHEVRASPTIVHQVRHCTSDRKYNYTVAVCMHCGTACLTAPLESEASQGMLNVTNTGSHRLALLLLGQELQIDCCSLENMSLQRTELLML